MRKKFTLEGTVTIGPKGQVVIPASAREKMGVSSGDKLLVLYVEDKNAVAFVAHDQAQKMIDKLGHSIVDIRNEINSESEVGGIS